MTKIIEYSPRLEAIVFVLDKSNPDVGVKVLFPRIDKNPEMFKWYASHRFDDIKDFADYYTKRTDGYKLDKIERSMILYYSKPTIIHSGKWAFKINRVTSAPAPVAPNYLMR